MQEPPSRPNRAATGRVVALVQARMGSRRLPGKMLCDICGYPLVHWVLARSSRARRLDELVLATSTGAGDDPLAAVADLLGVPCYRGSEHDVLGRFSEAAGARGAGTVVRICADNPLIAPEEIDRLVDFYQAALADGASRQRLYGCNDGPSGGSDYPNGLGAEIFSTSILHRAASRAGTARHREHVNAVILDHSNDFDVRAVPAPPEIAYPDIRLDIDTQEDLDRLRRLCQHLNFESSAVEIVRRYLALCEKDRA